MENELLNEFDIKVAKVKKLEEMGEKAYKAKYNKTHEIHDLEKYELGTREYCRAYDFQTHIWKVDFCAPLCYWR